jgi:hypothetical protein
MADGDGELTASPDAAELAQVERDPVTARPPQPAWAEPAAWAKPGSAAPGQEVRMPEDDPRCQHPAHPHGLTRLNRDDREEPDTWTIRRPGERWAGATVQRWCADCRDWTHVVDAGVPIDWDVDDRCAHCDRSFPLDPTA